MQDGSVDLDIARERTPLGTAGRSAGTEFLVPENADADVIETIRERIRNDRVILFCLHCADWKRTTKVRRVRDQPECPDCGSTRVAALNPWDDDRRGGPGQREGRGGAAAHRARPPRREPRPDAREARRDRAGGARGAAQRRSDHQQAARGRGRVLPRRARQEREYARTQSFWD